jgi:hypothetical protein
MLVKYTGSKTYTLFDGKEHVLGTLKYPSHFCLKAELKVNDQEAITLTPKKFRNEILLTQHQAITGQLRMKWWKMHMEVTLGEGSHYRLKRCGFWSMRFTLLDNENVERLKLIPTFRWKTFRYDFRIEPHISERFAVDRQTQLLSVYCANYIIASASSAT